MRDFHRPQSGLQPQYPRLQPRLSSVGLRRDDSNNSGQADFRRKRDWRRSERVDGDETLAAGIDDESTEEQKLSELEAVLLLSPEGISSRKLAKLAGLADATEARTLLRKLNDKLDATGRAYRIEEAAGGYTLMTRPQFAPWLRRLSHIPGELRLSQTALETLSIVAYRQPVLRATVEAIRGVGCSEVLKQLMEMDLVRISGRSEDLGRPYLYGTTRRFLQMFGLRSADRLPRIDWVNAPLASLTSSSEENGSEGKESSMNMTLATSDATGEIPEDETAVATDPAKAAIDDEEDDYYDDFDDDDDDDEDDAESDDDDWDDEDDDDDDLDDDGGGWEEVADDDDGWGDDDDEEDDDDDDEDDWGDDDDDDDDEWD